VGRLLIECTYVFEHPRDNSGIQRVVRNIVSQLPDISTTMECIPVVLIGGKVYRVLQLAPTSSRKLLDWLRRVIPRLLVLHHRFWGVYKWLARRWPLHHSANGRMMLSMAFKLASVFIVGPLRFAALLEKNIPEHDRRQLLEVNPNDTLVLLDSSWHDDCFPTIDLLKAKGLEVVAVIYDLIPITHPQFCDAGLVVVFNQWFDWIARTADGFIAISRTVGDQVQAEVRNRLGGDFVGSRWYRHFRLGSDLDLAQIESVVSDDIAQIFDGARPVYLAVSTIEPRKNHAYLLAAFDQLWAQGVDVSLCIIGKIGWKCDDLIARIRKHPEFNRRLFMCQGVDDSSLEFAYRSSRALLFPSFVEGFGLPLVEAMQRGLPAMASDIPVFREVGGDFLAYFDLDNSVSLADKIAEFESGNRFPAVRDVREWIWLSWRESAQEFIDKVTQEIAVRNVSPSLIKANAI